jgi:D-alanyl-lipoteichoic acid acyltransferase DltB (MBOAT superfamily)
VTLLHILIFTAAALLLGLFAGRWRGWLMLAASIMAIFWLQSITPVRTLDFWLPVATLALAGLVWAASRKPAEPIDRRETLLAAVIVIGLALVTGLLRYVGPLCCLTPGRPPQIYLILPVLAGLAALAAAVLRWLPGRRGLVIALVVLLLALLLALKIEPLARLLSVGVRTVLSQSPDRASALDIRWLGFSYVAFRLVHVLLDWVYGRLPAAISLRDFYIYVVFFPAFTAGPIDRVERFIKDLSAGYRLSAEDALGGGRRIALGVFKKFALADGLALFALNGQNAGQTTSILWLWVMLYAYAFRLYLDFAGYTDIAVGLARLMGVRLPENFDRPYRRSNLTVFWNAWHMTLAQWFRAYWFNPLTRKLRSGSLKLPVWLIILAGQLTTMALIGLWHGVTWGFVAWGAWHGVGLFLHNRWNNAMRARVRRWEDNPVFRRAYSIGGVLVTFHFVLLGWVWFAIPFIDQAGRLFLALFGVQP